MCHNKLSYTASKIMKSAGINDATIGQTIQAIKHECEILCKLRPFPSKFRVKITSDLLSFEWNSMFQELKKTAPILTRIIETAAETSAHVKPDHAIISMVAAILLKSCCKHMCKVQIIISALLYAGHASKKV